MSEIVDVWREYKETKDPHLQEELVVHYQGLVFNLAHKIVRKLKQGTEVEDLISDGMVGLVKALDAFDPERGFKFSTYATPVIRGSILNGLRKLTWLPERKVTEVRNFQKAVDKLSKVTGRRPSEEDIAKELEISAKEVFNIIADMSSMYLMSLDMPLGTENSDASVGDLVEDTGFAGPDQEFEFEEEREALRRSLEDLGERDRDIIESHYFEGETFDSISKRLGISKQRVSQLHLKAVRYMRKSLGDVEVSPDAMRGFSLGASRAPVPSASTFEIKEGE